MTICSYSAEKVLVRSAEAIRNGGQSLWIPIDSRHIDSVRFHLYSNEFRDLFAFKDSMIYLISVTMCNPPPGGGGCEWHLLPIIPFRWMRTSVRPSVRPSIRPSVHPSKQFRRISIIFRSTANEKDPIIIQSKSENEPE